MSTISDPSFLITLTVVALILSLITLVVAIRQTRRLENISESMSTQYVGEFPNDIPAITELVKDATKEVTILCDVPGYGHFSSPAQFLAYQAAVVQLPQTVKVSMTVYTREKAGEANREQLGESFRGIRESPAFRRFIRFHKIPKPEIPTDMPKLLEMLAQNYDKHLRDFNIKSIDVSTIARAIPLYFWIVDDRVAIFSFPSLSIDPPEVAFRTYDRNLISIFRSILQDVCRDPKPNEIAKPSGTLEGHG